MHVLWLGWLRDDALESGGGDEFAFAFVPVGEDFGRRGATENARVDEAGEFDAGDVAGGAVDAFEVPDCFGAVGGWLVMWTRERELDGLRFRVVFV